MCQRFSLQVYAISFLVGNWILGAHSLVWTDRLGNNSVQHVCVGLNLDLAWTLSTEPGESILQITWTFQGFSSELVAMIYHERFYPVPAYSGRVEFLPPAGLRLKQLVPSDAGNYSVEVHSTTAGGGFTSETRTVSVRAGVPPSTDGGSVWIRQEVNAVVDNSTRTAHIQLTCGHFTSRGEPPVEYVWKTPWGTTEPSTSYDNGNFHLVLPHPFTAGQFQCVLEQRSAESDCLSGSSELLLSSHLDLDETQARLSLQGADLGPDHEENKRLRHQLEQLLNTNRYTGELGKVRDQLLGGNLDACHYNSHHGPTTSRPVSVTDAITNTASVPQATTPVATTTPTTPAETTTPTAAATTFSTASSTVLIATPSPSTVTPSPSTVTPSPSTVTPSPSTVTPMDPCDTQDYSFMDDPRRDVTNLAGGLCDSTLPIGWYRLNINNVDAYIPTSCVPPRHCGTAIALWLNLQNLTLPDVGHETAVSLCGSTEDSCCDTQPGSVTARNCGTFYLYHLVPTDCSFLNEAYCATTTRP